MNSCRGARTAMIVGAGVAGLTAAAALAGAGWQVEIAEASPSRATSGWGLCLTGPALRALAGLGLADDCLAAGYGMSVITHVDVDGEPAGRARLPSLIGARRPAMAGIARPVLHRILHAEAERRGVVVRHGLTVTAVDQEGELVHVQLSDGSVRQVALLVGADGIRSSTRSLLGLAASLDYHGQMVWRALVPRPQWATGIHQFAGKAGTAGLVPLSVSQAYVFLTENGVERSVLPEAELVPRLQQMLETFPGRVAEVLPLVSASESVVRRPVLTAFLAGAWNRGSGVVIGDAAHAPAPQMASGAALAIEDGLVLAEELGRHRPVGAGLEAFVRRRGQRCRTLVETSVTIAGLERAQRHRETYPLTEAGHRLMAEPA
ncbi:MULTISPECIES: FAD-dependent monooxygenase [unclassified Streptomyces]|uniref:FAD-dependent monooxygenase n=1 Tax=unclassified Streptomyces TaxID=2593676 RepID=UPI000884D114|nr:MULTISPECIES: FAD-dependent monooxygenase [unclassified Streptomyces]PBC85886.1 2-polyprenyl-6-methoxyphenol hydroxylase-like FAD-dependent oxidoreductase [Streptomyces sp. 2321.6]SDR03178.1 2-polyprenyl-6-methoxyphenol hydroxylase [Streptomyces sp. KS_16]SED82017.1 2-polyprenyl-6-methoxyphenol hydroxylase [Streptomyces sp. 2133.1]SED92613.1 2-polyprenyl-6-methoxyphenol hydroxylase [Streptomyces sp. 2112.3]SNC72767.1 2-polyprenyl-6-methoxyphenol hydroxylase [Streptomyces sp. 2114.4]